jgi:zinc D-Ala-D-Ala carboxypeptidase
MGDLTRNFSLDEFLVSSKADQLGIANTPTDEHLRRLREVTAPSLQVIRDLVGRSIVITSAYRNPAVNKAVRGVANSDHPQAWAVDCHAAAMSPFGFAIFVRDAMPLGRPLHGMIDQLIYESSRGIAHISFAPRRRAMLLTQRGGPGSPFEVGINA